MRLQIISSPSQHLRAIAHSSQRGVTMPTKQSSYFSRFMAMIDLQDRFIWPKTSTTGRLLTNCAHPPLGDKHPIEVIESHAVNGQFSRLNFVPILFSVFGVPLLCSCAIFWGSFLGAYFGFSLLVVSGASYLYGLWFLGRKASSFCNYFVSMFSIITKAVGLYPRRIFFAPQAAVFRR